MRKSIFASLSLFVCLSLLLPPMKTSAFYSQRKCEAHREITTLTSENEHKILQINPFPISDEVIGVTIEFENKSLVMSDNVYLTVNENGGSTLCNQLAFSEYKSWTIENVSPEHEYQVCVADKRDDCTVCYSGTFIVHYDSGVLSCDSFIYCELYRKQGVCSDTVLLNAGDRSEDSRSVSAILYESESNNSQSLSNTIQSDDTTYGRIQYSGDVDWYNVTFHEYGYANFWLGDIPSGQIYYLQLWDTNGVLVWANGTGSQQQIYNYVVSDPEKTYYLKVYSGINGGYSSSYYRIRAKIYPIETDITQCSYEGPVDSINYYYNGTSYQQRINDALYNWHVPPTEVGNNNLHFNYCGSNNGLANLSFQDDTYTSSPTMLASTSVFYHSPVPIIGANEVNQDLSDWDYGIVVFQKNAVNQYLNNSNIIRGIASHEIGHFIGLKHNDYNPYSIMCMLEYGRQVYKISKTDNRAVNLKY